MIFQLIYFQLLLFRNVGLSLYLFEPLLLLFLLAVEFELQLPDTFIFLLVLPLQELDAAGAVRQLGLRLC